MTPRERRMVLTLAVVGGLALIGGGAALAVKLKSGLDQKRDQIAQASRGLNETQARFDAAVRAYRRLEHWKAISLPSDSAGANIRYRAYLDDLCRRHLTLSKPIPENASSRSQGNRNVTLTTLSYAVKAEGKLPQLVDWLQEFYATNLPHQVRKLTLKPRGDTPDAALEIDLEVEVAALTNLTNRDFLPAVPDIRLVGLETLAALKGAPSTAALTMWTLTPDGMKGSRKLASLVQPERKYGVLHEPGHNIFAEKQPPSVAAGSPAEEKPSPDRGVLQFVEMTVLTTTKNGPQVSLWNRQANDYERLPTELGRRGFEVRDVRKEKVVTVKVEHIDLGRGEAVLTVDAGRYQPRAGNSGDLEHADWLKKLDGKHYRIRPGETLRTALQSANELKDEEWKTLSGKLAAGNSKP